jgi:predicted DNA-binding protein
MKMHSRKPSKVAKGFYAGKTETLRCFSVRLGDNAIEKLNLYATEQNLPFAAAIRDFVDMGIESYNDYDNEQEYVYE